MAVDPLPFEAEMPAEVGEAMRQASAGQGPALAWYGAAYPNRQIDASLALLRSGAHVLAGWLAGIAMFGDNKRVIAGTIDRERLYAAIPHILDAFAAGIRAGVKPTKHQWGSIERLVVRNTTASLAFLSLLPLAVCLESPITRDHACRIAALLGEPAQELLAVAKMSATARQLPRLDTALATFGPAPLEAATERALLERLLVAWRATRDPELEPPIARLGRMLATIQGPLRTERPTASYYEIEGIWQRRARERDPADLDILLDVPLPWVGDARSRIEQLARREPDPRLARLLELAIGAGDAVFEVATQAQTAPLLDDTVRLAPLFASRGLEPRLAAITRVLPGASNAIAVVADAIARTPAGTADPALLAEARAATRERQALDEMIAQVARDPDDLGLRGVLADALQAAGDPRGEFIALQLAIASGATDPKLHARAALLLDAHFEIWTADLPNLGRAGTRFERGFVTAASFEGNPAALALSLERPIWSTIERLDATQRTVDLAAVLRHAPRLRALTSRVHDAFETMRATGPHPQVRALGTLFQAWFPRELDVFPELAVLGGHWFLDDSVPRVRAAMREARAAGLGRLVWFDVPDLDRPFECVDASIENSIENSIELGFTYTRGRGGGFAPDGWAVCIPRQGAVRIAWDGTPSDAFVRDLRSLVGSAERLGRGVEVYLPPTIAVAPELARFAPGRPIDLSVADRT